MLLTRDILRAVCVCVRECVGVGVGVFFLSGEEGKSLKDVVPDSPQH